MRRGRRFLCIRALLLEQEEQKRWSKEWEASENNIVRVGRPDIQLLHDDAEDALLFRRHRSGSGSTPHNNASYEDARGGWCGWQWRGVSGVQGEWWVGAGEGLLGEPLLCLPLGLILDLALKKIFRRKNRQSASTRTT